MSDFQSLKAFGEKMRRTHLAMWAYAYEVENVSLVPDAVFDEEARRIDLSVDTDRPDLDAWFRNNFDPDTGVWVHQHPELSRIADLTRNAIKAQAWHSSQA